MQDEFVMLFFRQSYTYTVFSLAIPVERAINVALQGRACNVWSWQSFCKTNHLCTSLPLVISKCIICNANQSMKFDFSCTCIISFIYPNCSTAKPRVLLQFLTHGGKANLRDAGVDVVFPGGKSCPGVSHFLYASQLCVDTSRRWNFWRCYLVCELCLGRPQCNTQPPRMTNYFWAHLSVVFRLPHGKLRFCMTGKTRLVMLFLLTHYRLIQDQESCETSIWTNLHSPRGPRHHIHSGYPQTRCYSARSACTGKSRPSCVCRKRTKFSAWRVIRRWGAPSPTGHPRTGGRSCSIGRVH